MGASRRNELTTDQQQNTEPKFKNTTSQLGVRDSQLETRESETEDKSKLKKVWKRLGLDVGTVLMMVKYITQ